MSDTLERYGITPTMTAAQVALACLRGECACLARYCCECHGWAGNCQALHAALTAVIDAREAQARAQGIEQGRREAWEILSAHCRNYESTTGGTHNCSGEHP
jgi:hypothetical protein